MVLAHVSEAAPLWPAPRGAWGPQPRPRVVSPSVTLRERVSYWQLTRDRARPDIGGIPEGPARLLHWNELNDGPAARGMPCST